MMTTYPMQPASNCLFIENGLKEIFGTDFIKESSDLEGRLPVLFSLRKALTHKIGDDESSGLCIRAGRAGFYYWMRQFSAPLGWKTIEFRLLPAPARIRRALTDLLQWMENEKFFKSELTETSTAWQISIKGLTGTEASLECNYFTGMIQELACWAGSGKFYPTREDQCQVIGGSCCVFLIDKQPAV